MKKIAYLLLFAGGTFLIQPAQASKNSVFNDSAAFTLAKAVKLGRSSTSLSNSSIELEDKLNPIGGEQASVCLVGFYDSKTNGCQSCAEAMEGCNQCDTGTVCTHCDDDYELIGSTCKKSSCSWNHNNAVVLGSKCGTIDGYGQRSTITVPNTNPTYSTVNLRFWNNATVSGGAFTTTNLVSTGHTSWQLGNLNSTITFKNPVTVTGTVILQEDSADAGKGVKMIFNGGLKGNPTCVVEKQVASSGCSSASCSKKVETERTCTCTSSQCAIDTVPSTCSSAQRFFWNANGAMTVPSGYYCIDGYGANANITMPSGASLTSVNVRFWDYASVKGSFTTADLYSTGHTSWYLDDLDTVITFNDPVTVTGTVHLQEASSSTKGARKGVTMKFPKGLKGSPKCVVEKHNSSSGCGYASCSKTTSTDAICECSSTECVIKDGCEGTFDWNSDGAKTIPAGYCNIWGYGNSATITMPEGSPTFQSVALPFWNNATVNGSFTTSSLSSTGHTDTELADLDSVITFNDPVTVTGTVTLQEASTGGKGVTMKFPKGLKGSPSCKVEKREKSTGCTSASCSKVVSTKTTCSCSSRQCSID